MEDQLSNGETNSLSNSRQPKFRNSAIVRFLVHQVINYRQNIDTSFAFDYYIMQNHANSVDAYRKNCEFFSHMFDSA